MKHVLMVHSGVDGHI